MAGSLTLMDSLFRMQQFRLQLAPLFAGPKRSLLEEPVFSRKLRIGALLKAASHSMDASQWKALFDSL